MANIVNHKQPADCTDIAEVRHEIDLIDREIVQLLSTRMSYVHEVVKYKAPTAKGIEADDRRADVLRTRRQWAEDAGLDPDVIEKIYVQLIQYFIDEEKKLVNLSPKQGR